MYEFKTVFSNIKDKYIVTLNANIFETNIKKPESDVVYELLVGHAYYLKKLEQKGYPKPGKKSVYVYISDKPSVGQ